MTMTQESERLYHDLKGAHERLCRAQTGAPFSDRLALGRAMIEIEGVQRRCMAASEDAMAPETVAASPPPSMQLAACPNCEGTWWETRRRIKVAGDALQARADNAEPEALAVMVSMACARCGYSPEY
jgi:hypothetical protein